ncbi:uncharacterized protein [Clytia hemisphaerica]|uniref:uncharacterized protein n=1 Tax=Clytia hemisphaerica TaxID=252671 RepID=UPI0034D70EB1
MTEHWFLSFLILSLGSVATLKTIHISHNGQSKDNSTCGQISQPCFHLDYGINTISMDTNIISLDANYNYNYNRTIELPHSLTLTSYYDNEDGPPPKASLNITMVNTDEKVIFKARGDLSLYNLNVSVNAESLVSIFQVQSDTFQHIEIHDSEIFLIERSGNTDLLSSPYNANIKFNKTKLFYHLIDQDNVKRVMTTNQQSREALFRYTMATKRNSTLVYGKRSRHLKQKLNEKVLPSSAKHNLHSEEGNPSVISQHQPPREIVSNEFTNMRDNDKDFKFSRSDGKQFTTTPVYDQLMTTYRINSTTHYRNKGRTGFQKKITIQMYDSVFHADSYMGDFKFQIEPLGEVSVNLFVSNCCFTQVKMNIFPTAPPTKVVFKDSLFESTVIFVDFSHVLFKTEQLVNTLNMVNCTGDILIFSANFDDDSNCQISDSNFTNSKFDLTSMLIYTEVKVSVHVWNCVFSEATVDQQLKVRLRGSYNGAAPHKNITIMDSFFQRCTYGALVVSGFAFKLIRTRFADNFIDGLDYKTGVSAALTVQSDSIEIENCTFINNTAPNGIPNSLKTEFISGKYFHISNTHFESGKISIGDVNNVAFISEINVGYIFQNVSFYCAKPDYYLLIYGGTEQSFEAKMITCTRCGRLTYNAFDQSHVNYHGCLKKRVHNITCYACPYQASCGNGIQSRGNYWGTSNATGFVTFYPCPPFYCCSSLRTCSSYNTCVNNRQGRLCGACKDGYSLSIFNKCVRTKHCNYNWFWLAYSILCVLAFIFFLYFKDVLRFMKMKLCALFCSSNDADLPQPQQNRNIEESLTNSPTLSTNTDDPINTISNSSNAVNVSMDGDNESIVANKTAQQQQGTFSGTIKIAFFFYQAASIIRINASAKAEYTIPIILNLITSFFNIKIDDSSSSGSSAIDVCPLQTSNTTVIKVISLSTILSCWLLFLAAILITYVYRHIKNRFCQRQPIDQNEAHDHGEQSHSLASRFINRLKGSYVQLLLFAYASIAKFCLQAVHCIEINGHKYLYYQAEQKCYQGWQMLVFGIIFSWVVPFPFVLYFACRWLRDRSISANGFLIMVTFPPAMLVYVSMSMMLRCCNSFKHTRLLPAVDNDQSNIERESILLVLNEPFRVNVTTEEEDTETDETQEDDNNQLIWEPVLILRRLVLTISATFFMSPVQKLYPAALLLIVYTLHDHLKQPYSDKRLNLAHLVSMLLLVILVMINTFWAYSDNIDLIQDRQFYLMGSVLLYFELFIMLAPVLLVVLYGIVKLGRFVYKRYFLKKQD